MSTWIKVDKDGRSYNVAPNATPPSGGGGTLQAYRNSYSKDLVFLPSDDSNKALAPIFTGLSELSCVKNQNNVTIPEQYDFSTPVELNAYNMEVIEYVDPSTGVSTIYGFKRDPQVLYNITDPANIIEVADFSSESKSYTMKLVTSEGIIFYDNSSTIAYYLFRFGSTSPVEIAINIPSLGEISLNDGIVVSNGTYFVNAQTNNGEYFTYYLIYSTDLSNWSYLELPSGVGSVDRVTYSHGEYIIQYYISDGGGEPVLVLKHSTELVPLDEWADIVFPDGLSLMYSYNLDSSNIFIAYDSNGNTYILKANSDFTLSSIGMLPSLFANSGTEFKLSDEKTMLLVSFGHDTTMQLICAITDKVQLLQIAPHSDGSGDTIYITHVTSKFVITNSNKAYLNNSIQYTRESSSDITL